MAPLRDRLFRGAITITCARGGCDKRLAHLDLVDDEEVINGVEFVHWEHSQLHRAGSSKATVRQEESTDWRRVVCPQCGFDWQGRTWQIAALIDEAHRAGQTTAKLRVVHGERRWPVPVGAIVPR